MRCYYVFSLRTNYRKDKLSWEDKLLASTTQLVITGIYFITASIQTFDKRLLQAKRFNELPPDEPLLPTWLGVVTSWIHYGVIVALFVTGWKYALLVLVVGFVLAVLPVLETIGNVLMRPFHPK